MRWNKPILLLISVVLLVAMTVGAFAKEGIDKRGVQVSKTMKADYTFLDINQIECYIQNDGTFGENPQTGGDGFYFPRGQRTLSIIYTAGLWLAGMVNNEIRTAVSCYGSEFQPGSILADHNADETTLEKYKIYKYNAGDVVEADAIAQGCPGEVLGDQMCFYVCNDAQSHSGMWKTPPMKIELQATSFAFNRTGALGQTIFLKFKIVNKGTDTIDSTFVGVFFDPDLGNANDDATGCDTTLGIGYVYNGDGFDEKYGVGVPALASDFFQGPIVSAPGQDAVLPDGTVIPDSRILPMTAFFVYINGSPLAGMTDPNAAAGTAPQEAYYFMNGFRGNGQPWEDPVAGNTPFPFAGDPVADTGWLIKHISVPKDVRMGNASGPFTLAPGDEQDVVVGLVVGVGTDNLSSVTVMKFYDKAAQQAYDMNFELPAPPPQPLVNVAELDEEIVLTWDATAADFSDGGYEFEGYNLWQGEGEAGPWTRIATFDKINGLTTIWDQNYSVAIGALVEMPVQFGVDAGLNYKFHVTKDYLNNTPLINVKRYYFAVTGYAYNPAGVPKVLENAQVAYLCIPQKPVLDVAYHSAYGDLLPVTRVAGSGSIDVEPYIIDPTAVIPADYQLRVESDSTYALWRGSTVLWSGKTNDAMNEDYEVADGIQVKVGGFTFETPEDYAGITFVPEAASARFDYTNYAYFGYPANALGSWGVGTEDVSLLQSDIELRWTGEYGDPVVLNGKNCIPVKEGTGSIATCVGGRNLSAANNPFNPNYGTNEYFPIRIPFEAWDMENNIQINTFVYDRSQTTAQDPFYAFFPTNRTYFWTNALPYRETVIDVDNVSTNEGDYNTWSHVLYLSTWEKGDIVRISYMNPVVAGSDKMGFSTRGLEPTQTAETAAERLDDINVFPNPYFGHNKAEGTFYTQFVTFSNLPEDDCTIRIFTLAGSLVQTLVHNNGTPFERWYLQNEEEVPVASGMYLVHVETGYGNKILKLGIINRESYYQHL